MGVGEEIQRPPQMEVWVQVEPVGQGSPPTVQETVKDGPGVVEGEGWRAASVGWRRENKSIGFIFSFGNAYKCIERDSRTQGELPWRSAVAETYISQ
jgi:hypothetical protein